MSGMWTGASLSSVLRWHEDGRVVGEVHRVPVDHPLDLGLPERLHESQADVIRRHPEVDELAGDHELELLALAPEALVHLDRDLGELRGNVTRTVVRAFLRLAVDAWVHGVE